MSSQDEGAFLFPPLNTPREATLDYSAEFYSNPHDIPRARSASSRWSSNTPGSKTDNNYGDEAISESDSVSSTYETDSSCGGGDVVVVDRQQLSNAEFDGDILQRLLEAMEREVVNEGIILACLGHLAIHFKFIREAQLMTRLLQQLMANHHTSPRIIGAVVLLISQLLEWKETYRSLFRLDFPLLPSLMQATDMYIKDEELCRSLISLICSLHLAGSACDRKSEVRSFLAVLLRASEIHLLSNNMCLFFASSIAKVFRKYGPEVIGYLFEFGICPLSTKLLSDRSMNRVDLYSQKPVLLQVLSCYLDCLIAAATTSAVPIWKLHNYRLQQLILQYWAYGIETSTDEYVVLATDIVSNWLTSNRLRLSLPKDTVQELLEANILKSWNYPNIIILTLTASMTCVQNGYIFSFPPNTFFELAKHYSENCRICSLTCNLLQILLESKCEVFSSSFCAELWSWNMRMLLKINDTSLQSAAAGLLLACALVPQLPREEVLQGLYSIGNFILKLDQIEINESCLVHKNVITLLVKLLESLYSVQHLTNPQDDNDAILKALSHLKVFDIVLPWTQNRLEDQYMSNEICQLINLIFTSGWMGDLELWVTTYSIPILLVEILSEHTDVQAICSTCCNLMLILCGMQTNFQIELAESGAAELLLRAMKLQRAIEPKLCFDVEMLLQVFRCISEQMDSRICSNCDYLAFLQMLKFSRHLNLTNSAYGAPNGKMVIQVSREITRRVNRFDAEYELPVDIDSISFIDGDFI